MVVIAINIKIVPSASNKKNPSMTFDRWLPFKSKRCFVPGLGWLRFEPPSHGDARPRRAVGAQAALKIIRCPGWRHLALTSSHHDVIPSWRHRATSGLRILQHQTPVCSNNAECFTTRTEHIYSLQSWRQRNLGFLFQILICIFLLIQMNARFSLFGFNFLGNIYN